MQLSQYLTEPKIPSCELLSTATRQDSKQCIKMLLKHVLYLRDLGFAVRVVSRQ